MNVDPADPADVLRVLQDAFDRLAEPLRREIAYQYRGQVVEGSGRAVRPKKLDSLHSVRFSHDDAKQLGQTAERMGFRGMSDLLRAAARAAIQPIGFRCPGHENASGSRRVARL